MDIFRFDRSDRIGTEVVIALAWFATLVGLLAQPVSRWVDGRPLLIDVESGRGPHQISLEGAAGVDRLIMIAPSILAVVFLGIGAWLMARVLRGVAGGDPFARAQVRRLRQLAVMMLILPVVVGITTLVATAAVQQRLDQELDAAMTLRFEWLLAGLVTAAVAQAFSDGAALRESTDGLI